MGPNIIRPSHFGFLFKGQVKRKSWHLPLPEKHTQLFNSDSEIMQKHTTINNTKHIR